MKYKVIFDTNSIRNTESTSNFLGGRNELERFSKVSEIIIPDLVLEEIKTQKRRSLSSKRDSFLANPFHFLRKINIDETKSFDIENWLTELQNAEKINYRTIKLSPEGILEKMKEMSLTCRPPFEKYIENKSSDKGFKDAYIYFTILEYLASSKDKKVFFVTKDERLKEAFSTIDRVKVIKDYEEFQNDVDEYFKETYFINRLKEEVDEEIEEKSIEDTWLNLGENWVLKIISNDKTYFVEVDFASKEILKFTDVDFSDAISRLIASGSFATTHESVDTLKGYIDFLSDQDIHSLIKAATENNNIYSIAGEEDVKEFFVALYEGRSQILPDDVKALFKNYFEIK